MNKQTKKLPVIKLIVLHLKIKTILDFFYRDLLACFG